ncbi:hypothetical protein C0J52_12628 [Blattella germanica]|nr:hypothetical protein C0J52_12628 [Blattella germanica]
MLLWMFSEDRRHNYWFDFVDVATLIYILTTSSHLFEFETRNRHVDNGTETANSVVFWTMIGVVSFYMLINFMLIVGAIQDPICVNDVAIMSNSKNPDVVTVPVSGILLFLYFLIVVKSFYKDLKEKRRQENFDVTGYALQDYSMPPPY